MADNHPHWGHTRHHGFAVHARAVDHLPEGSRYQRFNKRVAIWLTKNVGSMTAFWLFTLASMTVAPSCLYAAGYIHWKTFITTFGFELLATLILSTWLELALMPAIMVGQNLQATASDARAAKQFEDIEVVTDRLDTHTQGGITEILTEVAKLGDQVANLAGVVQQVMATRAEHDGKVAASAERAATAAESAFVATQALAANATGPQPVLKDPEPAAPAKPARGRSAPKGKP